MKQRRGVNADASSLMVSMLTELIGEVEENACFLPAFESGVSAGRIRFIFNKRFVVQ